MTDRTHLHVHRVSYADCTLGNHVYYGRYLEWIEAARGELFRAAGCLFLDWQDQDAVFPVTECHLKYLGAARYDDVLTIQTRLEELNRLQMRFAYTVVNQHEQRILEASTLHVCTSIREKRKRVPIPVYESLQAWMGAPCE